MTIYTGTNSDDSLVGSTSDDTLYGLDGNDTLDGGGGTDTLFGGTGDDTYYVFGSRTNSVKENLGEGTDTVIIDSILFGMTTDLNHNIENATVLNGVYVRGNELANVLIGCDAVTNIISGYDGNDTLDGRGGADSMSGGTGDDTYYVDNIGDQTIELTNEGTDTVISSVTYTLANNVENLTLTGTAALNGTGNALNNILIGNSGINTLNGGDGDDLLDGGAGADTLIGGSGIDTASYASATDSVLVMLDAGGVAGPGWGFYNDAAGDVLLDIENLRGSNYGDLLFGSAGVNTIWGGDGGDQIDGFGGADFLDGGAGSDTVSYYNSSSGVTASLSGGVGVGGDADGDVLVNFENMWGSDFNDTLTGTTGSNLIIGYEGDDTFVGLGGGDMLYGGGGNDTVSYASLSEGVQVVLQGNGVLNDGHGYYGSQTDILDNFENVKGTDYDDFFLGSEVANVFDGGAGNDVLFAGNGNDTLIGGSGDDAYGFIRGGGQDIIIENDAAPNTDLLDIGDVNHDQLWFRHVGNDLEVSVIGTADKATIVDWYSGAAHHLEQFVAEADGKLLLDSGVENLVSAMSAFAPPSAGQTTLPPTYQTALATVIAANWS